VTTEPSPREAAALALYPAVFRFALHLTRHWHDGEDLAQSTYLRALPRLAHLDERADVDLKPWLLTVCRSVWLDEIRRRSSRPQSAALVDMHTSPPPYDQIDTAVTVQAALDRLPLHQAEVITWVHLQGYSEREWSKASATPLGTTKTRIRLARRGLRAMLEAA
jgi:RNA polymerase sigma-70 factor (ECF subfamily)